MSIYLWQSLLAIAFFIFALAAFFTMFAVMGKMELKASTQRLRSRHKIFGGLFVLILIVQSLVSLRHVQIMGDQLSLRAVLHAVLALTLIVVFSLKILSVKYFKKFMKFAPALGMIIISLVFLVTATSAGYFFLRMKQPISSLESQISDFTDIAGVPENGQRIFRNRCETCHVPDSDRRKTGPGMKGILAREKLPSSERPATAANIIEQLHRPLRTMPAFPGLSQRELADLLSYLETL